MALPGTAVFDPDTQVFSWQPTHADVGTHTVRFTVTDAGGLSDYEDVAITVQPVSSGGGGLPLAAIAGGGLLVLLLLLKKEKKGG